MKVKGILSFVLLVIILAGCNSSGSEKNAGTPGSLADGEIAEISFREYEHDFGKITEGEKVAHIFAFENKGPGNLVIKSASTSCGCTVPKYDRAPIPAGKGGSLEVVFDSNGRNGIQTKTISVRSNSKTKVVILKITAEVVSRNK
ncbi:MAG: DUF1573 domain-containing protein [Bacteroidia bacterium]|nr:MAG: DUF1573 domain-containing protein [Bacteroidia bacterium]